MANKLSFTGAQLFCNDKSLDINVLKSLFNEQSETFADENKIHDFEFDFSTKYLTIVLGDGTAKPRNPETIKLSTLEKIENPRTIDEVEPKISFCLIELEKNRIWMSDFRKLNQVVSFFNSKSDEMKFSTKNIFNTETLLERIKSLDQLKLCYEPDLLNNNTDLNNVLHTNIYGYGSTDLTLDFGYRNTPITSKILQHLTGVFNNKNSYKNLVISGRDERNLGMVFNMHNGIFRKIDFEITNDENGMKNSKEVFQYLMNCIEKENLAEK
jgi:hypothetical protein